MATRKPDRPRALGTAVQRGRLLAAFPGSRAVPRRNGMVWVGTLTPTEYTDSYEVLIDHAHDADPLVYVARPRLQLVDDKPLEHVYSWNTLCLYLGTRQWNSSVLIADTIVPWACEWLFFYELWLATGGEWLGDGHHPDPGSRSRAARRDYAGVKEAKLRRMTAALQVAYGTGADLDELLYNARLTPTRVRWAA
jgi:hypothetical protein